MTLAEIQKGIELLASGKRRVELEEWFAKDWKRGFQAAYFRWIARLPLDGSLWRKDHAPADLCRRLIMSDCRYRSRLGSDHRHPECQRFHWQRRGDDQSLGSFMSDAAAIA
ncbi:MAG TPA: hypothetical protein VGL53_28190 [Bryobacteraceae bacterium]